MGVRAPALFPGSGLEATLSPVPARERLEIHLWPHACFAIPDPRPQGYFASSDANPGSANSNASRTAGSVRRIHSRA